MKVQTTISLDDGTKDIPAKLQAHGINFSKFVREKLLEWANSTLDMKALEKELMEIEASERELFERKAVIKLHLDEMQHTKSNKEIDENVDALNETLKDEEDSKPEGKVEKAANRNKEWLDRFEGLSDEEKVSLVNEYKTTDKAQYYIYFENFLRGKGYYISGREIKKKQEVAV